MPIEIRKDEIFFVRRGNVTKWIKPSYCTKSNPTIFKKIGFSYFYTDDAYKLNQKL